LYADIPYGNTLYIYINSSDEIVIYDKVVEIDSLKDIVKLYISNPKNESTKAEKYPVEIEYFGTVQVSKAIISIQCERNTSYEFYIKVQNEIEKAYNGLRNELSIERFNKEYKSLTKSEKQAVNRYYPKIISEAEPNYIWKNGKLVKSYSK
jgi:hypothetical protein